MIALVAALYPVALVGSMILPVQVAVAARLLMAAAAFGALSGRAWPGRTTAMWALLLAGHVAASAVAAATAVDTGGALVDLARQIFLISVAMGVTLALGDPRARLAFVIGMAAVALSAAAIIGRIYLDFGDPVRNPFADVAALKAFAATRYDAPLNSLSFVAALGTVIALPTLMRYLPAGVFFVALAGLGVVLSGSRTAVLTLLASVPITLAVMRFQRAALDPRRFIPLLGIVATGIVLAYVVASASSFAVDLAALDEATTGRVDLWRTAWALFLERPVTGWGGASFGGLALQNSPLPAPGDVVAGAAPLAGAAHNALLTVLAERGLLGAAAGLLLVGFVWRQAVRLYQSAAELTGIGREVARMAPFAVALMVLRMVSEQPGLLGGGAESVVDFMSFGVAALIVGTACTLDRSGTGQPP